MSLFGIRLFAAIVPFDGDASPGLFADGALVGVVALPANTVADCQTLIVRPSSGLHSYWRYQLNPLHLTMPGKAPVAVIPFDCDVSAVRGCDAIGVVG
jgi:hypothetical protein